MSDMDPKYFTPGPWIVAEQFRDFDEDGEEITAPAIFQKAHYENELEEPCPLVVGETSWAEIENDLRLMAAAPDLLAALREVREWICNWAPNFEQDEEWPATHARMDDAIAKAEGRS